MQLQELSGRSFSLHSTHAKLVADVKMRISKRTVLITGCSDGGLGAALAIAFREAGLHVYATARNPSKMTQLTSLGIETLTLDVLSDSSIAACVSKLDKLDILVNNAGACYSMPVSGMENSHRCFPTLNILRVVYPPDIS